MADQPLPIQPEASDLEYDLAHEGADAAQSPPLHMGQSGRARGAGVPTTGPDQSGDYGYDLAHEIAGR